MTDKIQKYLQSLTLTQRKKIYEKFMDIKINGIGAADVKPLTDKKGLYRLRVGRLIRIIFRIEKGEAIIVDAGNRDSIYK